MPASRTAPAPSDAELAALARSGDREAASALVRRHEGLVHDAVGRLAVGPEVDLDDLRQAGLVGVWKAAEKWDPGSATGSKFSTYAFMAVRNAVYKELDRQTRQWRAAAVTDPAPPPDPDRDRFRMDRHPAPDAATRFDPAPVLAELSPLHARVLSDWAGLGGELVTAAGRPGGTREMARRVGLTWDAWDHELGLALLAARRVVRGERAYPGERGRATTAEAA